MSSLPVPVSPSTRTVEPVGATRSTCSSTASRAELLPMICSNLRRLCTWSSDPDLPKASTEISCLSRSPFLVGFSSPSPLEHSRAVLHRRTVLPELYCACSHRLHPHFRVAMCGYKDGRNLAVVCVQLRL